MNLTPLLQLVGGVSGVLLSVSAVMLINGLSYLNQSRSSLNSIVRDLSMETSSQGISRDAVVKEAVERYDSSLTGEKWSDVANAIKTTEGKLEDIRKVMWSTWRLEFVFTVLSLFMAGVGLVSVGLVDDATQVMFTAISIIGLVTGVFLLYLLAYNAHILSKITVFSYA